MFNVDTSAELQSAIFQAYSDLKSHAFTGKDQTPETQNLVLDTAKSLMREKDVPTINKQAIVSFLQILVKLDLDEAVILRAENIIDQWHNPL